MFGFSKKSEDTAVAEKKKVITSADIQADMDRLLKQDNSLSRAEELNMEIEITKSSIKNLEAKHKLASELGFTNSPTSRKLSEIKDEIREKEKEVKRATLKKEALDWANKYFHPYKYVDLDTFLEVLEKYNLEEHHVSYYAKEVPEENLLAIKNFKDSFGRTYVLNRKRYYHNDTDTYYLEPDNPYTSDSEWGGRYYSLTTMSEIRDHLVEDKLNKFHTKNSWDDMIKENYNPERLPKCADVNREIFIAAPKDHFNQEQIEADKKVLDPIAFTPVKGGVIIITAWDEEAKIPEIQNPLNN